MPDEEKKMVDIDTSGPEVDVELETQQEESEVSIPEEKETVTEVTSPAPLEASDEQQETKIEETKEDQKDELEVYSKDVQRRIAKLTKKWREAERQKEEALYFARIQKDTADKLSKKYSSLETNSLKTKETQIASRTTRCKSKIGSSKRVRRY
jgi:chromosome segregation ATPase